MRILILFSSFKCDVYVSHTLREERRLRVFENKILRRIFEPKRDENGGGVEKTPQSGTS